MLSILPIIPVLCPVLRVPHYSHYYAGILCASLPTKSSANNIAPNFLPLLNCIPSSACSTSFNKSVMNTEIIWGINYIQPWATPCSTLNESDFPPSKSTTLLDDIYIFLITRHILTIYTINHHAKQYHKLSIYLKRMRIISYLPSICLAQFHLKCTHYPCSCNKLGKN